MATKKRVRSVIAAQYFPYRYSQKLNTSYIDIALEGYRKLYNEWDFSPATDRDLDEDLFQYLEESVEEIPQNHNICVVFNIPIELKDKTKEGKSIRGLVNYFNYMIRKENNKRRLKLRTGSLYGLWGLILLFIATLADLYIRQYPQYEVFTFIQEGLSVGGWVLLWELCNIAFFGTEEHSIHLKTFKRLRDAKIVFSYR